jgi:hypothetical protein
MLAPILSIERGFDRVSVQCLSVSYPTSIQSPPSQRLQQHLYVFLRERSRVKTASQFCVNTSSVNAFPRHKSNYGSNQNSCICNAFGISGTQLGRYLTYISACGRDWLRAAMSSSVPACKTANPRKLFLSASL